MCGMGENGDLYKAALGTAHVLLSDLGTFTQALGCDNSSCCV